MVPVTGGSGGGAGGSGNSGGGGGGCGGGAVTIYSPSQINVSGRILAVGGEGGLRSDTSQGDGGVGSGGSIFLIAPSVNVTGVLNTSGGPSTNAGAGGLGRIRIDGITTFQGQGIRHQTASNYSGPVIRFLNQTNISGAANASANIAVIVQDSSSSQTFFGTADVNGRFAISLAPSPGKKYVTVVQNSSDGSVGIMGMAALLNITIPDTTPPQISLSLDPNPPLTGVRANITAQLTDDVNVSVCSFYMNGTSDGSFTILNKTVTGTSDQCSQNYTIGAAGSVINFTVLVNDTSGNINRSTLIAIVSLLYPNISQIGCSANGGAFSSCSGFSYGDTLSTIRTVCNSSNPGGVIDNVTFILTNIDDNREYFNINVSGAVLGYYNYSPNMALTDSGDYNLKTICIENPVSVNDSNWTLPYGRLLASLVSPANGVNVTKDRFFNFTSRVTCTGGECGSVNATLDPAPNVTTITAS